MIQKRMKKIQEIKQSEQRKTLASNDCFLTSSQTIHISNWMIIGLSVLLMAVFIILSKQYTLSSEQLKKMEEQAKDLEKLKQEIMELEKLSHTDDHLRVKQMYSSLSSLSKWTEIRSDSDSDVDVNALKRALTELKDQLNEKLTETVLKFAQKYAVALTLDPDTANPYLILSDDGKQVSDGDIKQDVPENPKRFDDILCVLAKQGFSSGRFYYEVQVEGKTKWDLGVVRESISRKGEITLSPNNGVWAVILMNENEYKACECPPVSLSLKEKPEKVGVFVDYKEGLVSFYDVGSRSHIYSFTGQTFTEKLYPLFDPCRNDGINSRPLIITPVSPVTDYNM